MNFTKPDWGTKSGSFAVLSTASGQIPIEERQSTLEHTHTQVKKDDNVVEWSPWIRNPRSEVRPCFDSRWRQKGRPLSLFTITLDPTQPTVRMLHFKFRSGGPGSSSVHKFTHYGETTMVMFLTVKIVLFPRLLYSTSITQKSERYVLETRH